MSKKIRVGVIYGGPSAERAISLITGKAICENLDKKKYDVIPLEMSKDKKFFLDNNYYKQLNAPGHKSTGKKIAALVPVKSNDLGKDKIDVVFLALHGTYGEDGKIQSILESLGVKYTGSGVLASALAMNKVFSSQIYFANGLPFPEFINFKKSGWKNDKAKILAEVKNKIGYPCVLKPVDQGSAVGVSIVKTEPELAKAILKTIKKFPWLMVQKFIKGREATCGVLEQSGSPFPLPPTEIIANAGEFYDYKSKYSKGGSTHICPANFEEHINEQIQTLAVQAHIALGCAGMSRTDIMVGDDGKLYVLETNTIPGMTPTSLFPEAAGKAGINFMKMLDVIIKAAI
ncbi:MAG: hypothetical protein A3J93_04505 [Candidatus Magasanikbacteria bacterium RIFOXYC2_FULL_42_28]|uniref:D-alanine--D-alanine ligase n=1 Tax=Candidatus Magasanikbacteria bacterium RIFOXYC2_FULL_42_28 TaxID=1798704 RepID=A0A1F6NX35_9BACT|nr:MAG: hypothetical protein A3J93_04505 [Candidatus Magasanikbacteria bacterium RIFOXYC2_FULL_42_28]